MGSFPRRLALPLLALCLWELCKLRRHRPPSATAATKERPTDAR